MRLFGEWRKDEGKVQNSFGAGFCLPGDNVLGGGGRSIWLGKNLSPCASVVPGGCHMLHHLHGSILVFSYACMQT